MWTEQQSIGYHEMERRANMSTRKTPAATTQVQVNGRLLEEREQLLGRIALLTNENKQLKKSLGYLLYEEIPFDEEQLLANVGSQPSLGELIREIEHTF